MKEIKIKDRPLGENHPVFIIVEACDNHLGNLETAKEMAKFAKIIGADAVKFQHHIPDEEMLKEGVPTSSNFDIPLYEFLKKYALKLEDHYELFKFCNEIGIIYLCTPFSLKAAIELNEMGVEAFKIGSGELTDIPTLKEIAKFGKPMIISTGMSTFEEIDETVNTLLPINEKIILMNCTSEYPPDYKDVNLMNIKKLKERYGLIVGHSDHTPDIYTSLAAVALGAKLIEKHFILDKRQKGPDQSVSIEPMEFYSLVEGIRKIEGAMGGEKEVFELEKPIRKWAHRSVVSLVDIPEGTIIEKNMVWTKRPGTGIPAKYLENVIGKKAKVFIPKDHLISWEEIE